MTNAIFVIALVALALFLVAAVPLVVIWALNTLFALGIAYTFVNWLATFVLLGVINARAANISSNTRG